ncbi:RluA family pseudouridine synthase [Paenibacillus tuaregi]|uniref:RluA family pseudouridine synthase n=1 Tax=Paenibacillus tuaregi TaxID=1816681 RepID=UPI00083940DA|nr:RluA family pseudouridine synthase [Paenibacillus tuaregi]
MKKKSYSNGRTTKISSPPKPRIHTVKEQTELLPFLIETLRHLSRNSVKSILARGQVTVNSEPVTAYNYRLEPGYIVSIHPDKVTSSAPLVGMTILYEDEHIIVIQKEHGLLSVSAGQENEITAYRQLMSHVRQSDPGNRIFIVHRLDRDTSGVMLFAKSEKVQQTLQNGWQDIVKERSYVALVDGEVKKQEGTISSWLKESSTLKMYSSPYPNDGQHAVTHYKKLQSNMWFSLLEVHLETGRKNQIRVHMEDIGHPVAGDKKYGSKSKEIGRLGLHARILAFEHPVTGEIIRFETDIPKVFMKPFKTAPSK